MLDGRLRVGRRRRISERDALGRDDALAGDGRSWRARASSGDAGSARADVGAAASGRDAAVRPLRNHARRLGRLGRDPGRRMDGRAFFRDAGRVAAAVRRGKAALRKGIERCRGARHRTGGRISKRVIRQLALAGAGAGRGDAPVRERRDAYSPGGHQPFPRRDGGNPEGGNPGDLVVGQTIALSKLQVGAELEIPIGTTRCDLRFRPGLRFVASDASGGAFAREEGDEAGPRSLGRRELESCGAGLDLRLEFQRALREHSEGVGKLNSVVLGKPIISQLRRNKLDKQHKFIWFTRFVLNIDVRNRVFRRAHSARIEKRDRPAQNGCGRELSCGFAREPTSSPKIGAFRGHDCRQPRRFLRSGRRAPFLRSSETGETPCRTALGNRPRAAPSMAEPPRSAGEPLYRAKFPRRSSPWRVAFSKRKLRATRQEVTRLVSADLFPEAARAAQSPPYGSCLATSLRSMMESWAGGA